VLQASQIEFGNDIDVVKSKFYLMESNVNFILGNYKASLNSSGEGLKHIEKV